MKKGTGNQIRRREIKRRPRLRWMDDKDLDLRNNGVKRWRTTAFDGE